MQPAKKEIVFHFFFLLIIIIFAELFITMIPINISSIHVIYRQIIYSSNYIEPVKYLVYLTIIIINLHCFHPKRITKSFIRKNFTQMSIWFCLATLLYGISGNTTLPGFYDYGNFCTGKSSLIDTLHKEDGTFGYQFFLSMLDINRFITFKTVYENIIPLPKSEFCLFPGILERIIYLVLFFITPSLLYLRHGTKILPRRLKIGRDFSIKDLQAKEIVIGILVFLYFITHLIFFGFESWVRCLGYILVYTGIFVFLFCYTKYFMIGYSFYIDKFFLCYLIAPLACLRAGFDCVIFSIVVSVILIEKKNKRLFFGFWEKDSKQNEY